MHEYHLTVGSVHNPRSLSWYSLSFSYHFLYTFLYPFPYPFLFPFLIIYRLILIRASSAAAGTG